MKRICCYCDCWESGGIESFLCNILLRMDITDLEVDIVAAQIKGSVFTQRLEAHGVRFLELSGQQRNIAKNYARFRKLLCERQYDTVYLNIFQGMSLYYVLLAKKAGIPVRIAHSHNTDLRHSPTRTIKLLLHRLCRKHYAPAATAFWACSEAAAKFMFPSALLQERGYRFIPNGIETQRFQFDPTARETVRRELVLENRFVIGNVGRLCYQKNQSFLLDVLAEAQKICPESCLLLIGDGEERNALEAKAQSLGIAEHVVFYGTTCHVEKLFWAMDVFAFPSLFEGLGIVAVEAQAAGLPVVCSQHVPQEAFVTPNAQRLPLTCGAQMWAQTLLNLVGKEREQAHEAVRQCGFDVANVVRDITVLLVKKDGEDDNRAEKSS